MSRDPRQDPTEATGMAALIEALEPSALPCSGDTGSAALPDAEAVAAYLRAHPDFLLQRPDLVDRLSLPDPARPDGVVDLRTVLVDRLRGDVERLTDQQRALVAAGRANQNALNRVHAAVLFLLDAGGFEDLVQTVTTDLSVLLDLDMVCLLVESNGLDQRQALSSGVQVVDPGFVDRALGGRDILLQGDIDGAPDIYGQRADKVHSQALARLSISSVTPPCLLALGSREPDMFDESMRTEFISFLARVLERTLRSWLDLPP